MHVFVKIDVFNLLFLGIIGFRVILDGACPRNWI